MMFAIRNLEKIFSRSLYFSFCWKKFLLVFSAGLFCKSFFISVRSLVSSPSWISMSLIFLPIFVSLGLFLVVGIVLSRVYCHEVKNAQFVFWQLILSSLKLLGGASYIFLPIVLSYFLLWLSVGVLSLLEVLPLIGHLLGKFILYGPFVVVFASLMMSFTGLLLLFFITPAIALGYKVDITLFGDVLCRCRDNLLTSTLLFMVGIFPSVFTLVFLFFTTFLIQVSNESPAILFIPFLFITTPFTIFFFNFGSESYFLLRHRESRSTSVKVVINKKKKRHLL